MEVIDRALKEGRNTLSEYEAKQVLASHKLPVTHEELVDGEKDLLKAAEKIGYPVVIKGCSADIAHKTESGLIRVDVRNVDEAILAFKEIRAAMNGSAEKAILVQQMVTGGTEVMFGMNRDP